jgi:hypothetical protein
MMAPAAPNSAATDWTAGRLASVAPWSIASSTAVTVSGEEERIKSFSSSRKARIVPIAKPLHCCKGF